MKSRNAPLMILLLLAVVFVLGIVKLFELRFEAGDVYAPYSTLRSDPLGTSAFYESLQELPEISVSRDYSADNQLPEGRDMAYLHLAGSRYDWEEVTDDMFKEIETFVREGGRLVIAFAPEAILPRISHFEETDADDNKKSDTKDTDPKKPKDKFVKPAKKKKKIGHKSDPLFHMVKLTEKWGFGFSIREMKQNSSGAYEPVNVRNDDEPSLPEKLDWHSGVVMTNLDKTWHVLYSRGSYPVLAERKLGSGSVVFSTDSYFLSNEAMQKDRQPELLAWVVGPYRHIMFDEAHLGITEEPGVATLLRKYRLHGVVAALLLLAGLFIWKNSLGFGPERRPQEAEAFVAGKDSASGFVNLLRRHVKPQKLLITCVAEWRKSLPKGKFSAARIERVEAFMRQEEALAPKERNPVRSYQTICAILKQRQDLPIPEAKPQTNTKTT